MSKLLFKKQRLRKSWFKWFNWTTSFWETAKIELNFQHLINDKKFPFLKHFIRKPDEVAKVDANSYKNYLEFIFIIDMITLFYLMISDDNIKHFVVILLSMKILFKILYFFVEAWLLNIKISVVKIHVFLGT